MNDSELCPKCRGEMVQGFLADRGNANAVLVGTWSAGAPEKSFWYNIKPSEDIPIGVFRCARCGFLEAYARPEFAPK